MNDKPKIAVVCDACGTSFTVGSGAYGHRLKGYGLYVCRPCYSSNWDGWSPYNEAFIVTSMKAADRELPSRLSSGFLPREF